MATGPAPYHCWQWTTLLGSAGHVGGLARVQRRFTREALDTTNSGQTRRSLLRFAAAASLAGALGYTSMGFAAAESSDANDSNDNGSNDTNDQNDDDANGTNDDNGNDNNGGDNGGGLTSAGRGRGRGRDRDRGRGRGRRG